MAAHIEHVDTEHPFFKVALIQPEDAESNDLDADDFGNQPMLVISYDEAIVITGHLARFARLVALAVGGTPIEKAARRAVELFGDPMFLEPLTATLSYREAVAFAELASAAGQSELAQSIILGWAEQDDEAANFEDELLEVWQLGRGPGGRWNIVGG
jgi:hypothetical protein